MRSFALLLYPSHPLPWIILTFLQMRRSMSFILDMTELSKKTEYLLGSFFGPLLLIFLRWYLCPSSTYPHSQSFLAAERTKILFLPKLLKSLLLPPTLSCTLSCMRGHKDTCLLPCIICKKNRVMQVLPGFSWSWSEGNWSSLKQIQFSACFFCVR